MSPGTSTLTVHIQSYGDGHISCTKSHAYFKIVPPHDNLKHQFWQVLKSKPLITNWSPPYHYDANHSLNALWSCFHLGEHLMWLEHVPGFVSMQKCMLYKPCSNSDSHEQLWVWEVPTMKCPRNFGLVKTLSIVDAIEHMCWLVNWYHSVTCLWVFI